MEGLIFQDSFPISKLSTFIQYSTKGVRNMNDTILIILLVLMAATFLKLVVGATRGKKAEKVKQES